MSSEKIVVVDIGGTTIKMARLTHSSEVEIQWEFQRKCFDKPGMWVQSVLATAPGLEQWPWVLGVPGSLENGKILHETPNLPPAWSGKKIARALEAEEFNFLLENDANLAALGEARCGAGREYNDLVCLTLGTGVGSGIIIENKIYRGATGAAGEMGHLIIEPDGKKCGCGDRGCLENYASASALEDYYRETTGKDKTAKEICAEIKEEEAAARAVERTANYLGRGIAQLINLLEPEAIIFSGGLSRDLDLLLPGIKAGRDHHLFANRTTSTPLLQAELEEPAFAGGVELQRQFEQCVEAN